jgi:hypothetical protein
VFCQDFGLGDLSVDIRLERKPSVLQTLALAEEHDQQENANVQRGQYCQYYPDNLEKPFHRLLLDILNGAFPELGRFLHPPAYL